MAAIGRALGGMHEVAVERWNNRNAGNSHRHHLGVLASINLNRAGKAKGVGMMQVIAIGQLVQSRLVRRGNLLYTGN